MERLRQPVSILLFCWFAQALFGCSKIGFPGVFKIDVSQGNVTTPEMIELLEPGLEKQQVFYVMGSSLVTDLFNADRWDYVYYLQSGDERAQKHHVTLYFEGDYLTRIDTQQKAP